MVLLSPKQGPVVVKKRDRSRVDVLDWGDIYTPLDRHGLTPPPSKRHYQRQTEQKEYYDLSKENPLYFSGVVINLT